MHMLELPHDQPLDKDERKQAGLRAQATYPATHTKGYRPVRNHPCLYCKSADRPNLRRRLSKQPWKEWYDTLLHPLAQVALAARDLAELQTPLFHLKVFPIKDRIISPVQTLGPRALWKFAISNCALVAFLESDRRYVAKARQLLLESVDANWGEGGWGGEDYEVGSGWDHAWTWNASLAAAYDLVADSFTPAERLRFEARLARDLEWCQTDPISPRYNPSWFGSVFMGIAALLLGRDDCVRKVEAMLDQYVDQVLWGEGEYFEGASYQAGCMEPQNLALLFAIRHVTGRNPSANARWAMRAEHWIRRASPLGTDVTHSDAALVSPTAQILMAALSHLPKPVAGWVVWMYERIGDPGWFHWAGSDAERRQGISAGQPQPPARNRRRPFPYPPDPVFWLMVPDPLPKPVEPPAGSYVARNAGLACLRTNWSMGAMHTTFFAPRFYGSPHSHWDALTFDFWAHGAYLVKNVGYHELYYASPHIPDHIAQHLGIQKEPTPIPPPAPWTTWQGWDSQRCFRMAPDMHNIPTIEGGGGNHWSSRADPLHTIVNTGWVQAARAHGGIAGSFTRIGKLGSDGTVIRSLIQVEPAPDHPGYLIVVDDVTPTENPQARCNWFLHPRGEHSGPHARPIWTTCNYLDFPPQDVRLEVCLPPEGLEYELRPDGCHPSGGSFQPGQYLDVQWTGPRRFWAVLRPARHGEDLPPAGDLPGNRGLRIGKDDLLLVRPLHPEAGSIDGIRTDAPIILARKGGREFYLALAGRSATLADGLGFEATSPVMITVRCDRGAVFCDRPHKQPTPMDPIELIVRDPRIKPGHRVKLDGKRAGITKSGGFALLLQRPGQHVWEIQPGR